MVSRKQSKEQRASDRKKIKQLKKELRRWERNSLELVYHRYTHEYAFDELREAQLDMKPNGINKDIGEEIDLVIGMCKWKNVDLEIIVAQFKTGAAY